MGRKVEPHFGEVPHVALSCIVVVDKARFLIGCTRIITQKELGTTHLNSPLVASLNNWEISEWRPELYNLSFSAYITVMF